MNGKKKTKIAMSGFFGDFNVGDDWLQLSVMKGLDGCFTRYELAVFTSNVKKNISLFEREGVNYDHCNFFYSGRWGLKEPDKKGLRSVFWLLSNLRNLAKCDIHLIGPGNLIKDNTNRFLASFWLLRGLLSYLLGSRFAFIAVGVADVKHVYSKYLIKKILNKALFITTRDVFSKKRLYRLGVDKPPTASFPDLTYILCDTGKEKQKRENKNIKKIGLSFANFSLKFFSYSQIQNYKAVIAEGMKRIMESREYEFFFFSFAGERHFNDNIMYDYLSTELKDYRRDICNYPYKNITDLKNEISTCDAFIGTRFHSVIFAVQGCVPTLALSWDRKAKNFFSEAKLDDYVIEIEALSVNNFLGAWNALRSNYTTYCSYLKTLNQTYHLSAFRHFDMLKRYLAETQSL